MKCMTVCLETIFGVAMTKSFLRAALVIALVTLSGFTQAAMLPGPDLGTITAPATVAFGDSNFTAGLNGAGAGGYSATNGALSYNFQDVFTFTLNPSANVSALAADIYFADASGAAVLFGVSNLEMKVNGPSGQFQAWTTVSNPASGLFQEIALLPTAALTSGIYTLTVRGLVAGSGSYSGSVLAAVPLPGVLLLLLSGLAGLVPVGLRKRSFAPV
jgi:hypothetical protein